MTTRNPITIRVPEEWLPVIDSRRGGRTLSEYVRELIRRDLPKRTADRLPAARPPGRPKQD